MHVRLYVVTQVLITLGLLDKPFAFFGHSMGALVMYELAHRLARDTRVAPRFLVISGCRPPNVGASRCSIGEDAAAA